MIDKHSNRHRNVAVFNYPFEFAFFAHEVPGRCAG
nr:MAG TPA: hypothetical protein [Caudoviricetes sp.]